MNRAIIELTPAATSRSHLWRGRLAATTLLLLVTLLAAEAFCRLYLGLGDPPLSVADPEVEYLFAPNQTRHRFGNLVHYNAWSMRSDDFPVHKSQANEFRVMVLGDSVVNGGGQTDQAGTVTAILQNDLSQRLNRPVIVGNISAGSWGPPNMLAYLRRFGLFDADVVAIVLSSHDYADAPTFEPIVGVSMDFPDHKPWCATWEALTRYLPRYIPSLSHGSGPANPSPVEPMQKDIDWSLKSLAELIDLARLDGATVLVAQHLEAVELPPGQPKVGHQAIALATRKAGVQPFDLEGSGATAQLYRDNIHPNAAGQAWIAARIREEIEKKLCKLVPSAGRGRSD
jgi:hypothetical protein